MCDHPSVGKDAQEDEATFEALRLAITKGEKGPFSDGPAVLNQLRERIRRRGGGSKSTHS